MQTSCKAFALILALLGPGAALAQEAGRVARVEVTPSHASVVAGETFQFSVTARDAAGRPVSDAPVVWIATPFDIAGCDSNGVVETFRPGRVYVIAFVGGTPGIAMLDIAERPPARLSISAPGGGMVLEGGVLQLEASAQTEIGDPLEVGQVAWRSLQPNTARVGPGGLVSGLRPGRAVVVAEAEGLTARAEIEVRPNPVREIAIAGAEGPVRAGDVVRLSAVSRDERGRELRGVPLGWSVAGSGAEVGSDGSFVAERAGTYTVRASAGRVSGSTAVRVVPRRDPRRVEGVAHAPLPEGVQAAELWPVGDVVYVSTIADAVYTFDISDPAAPRLADSLLVDARLINDVSTTADGKIGVLSREGASTRKNGLVFFDASDPLHPKVISEFSETMSGGVHSAFVYDHYVFATDDATGSLRIVDFSDPRNPRQIGRWEVPRGEVSPYQVDFLNVTPQRYLHDVYVADGLAYLAYWRDGLIILDVGNGIKGGSVTAPKLVSRYVYNHAQLYPPGYLAGTHAVFPYGDYVFIADESYSGTVDLFSREQFPTRGLLHVIDVSDLERPVKVAEYDPVEFGVHNFYVKDDLLYIGGYNGGIRVLDISGELRGDLRAQGRVIGSFYTGSLDGFRPNMALAWSAIPHEGFILASDINTGLWVAKVTPAPVP